MAATVGEDVITLRDLKAELVELCKRRHIPFEQFSREEKNNYCAGLMNEMINQRLLIQEAQRVIKGKSPKMYDQFTHQADEYWREERLPELLHEYAAEDEHQLREKLKEDGRSLDTIARMAREMWMSENFLRAKIKDKVKAELPELLKYYNDHIRDEKFDRPAKITWREIVVESGPQRSHADARRKINSALQLLARGADFAAVAREQSEGPSHSREQGGLMETSPGSYGVASVERALQSLPVGRISGVIEGPSSFHIVRVEKRRAAGPAAFEELQDQIREAILERKFSDERAAYIRKLRAETPVNTFLGQSADNRAR